MTSRLDEALLRSLTPGVLGILVRRGADFAAAEDAVQDALVEAVRVWPTAGRTRDPKGWLITVAWRRFLDATRSDTARRRREDLLDEEPAPGPAPALDDTLRAELDPALPRHTAVAAYLHERDGGPATAARLYAEAARLYAEAARKAPTLAERDHLTRQAARLNQGLDARRHR